jgi:hypothetical protein
MNILSTLALRIRSEIYKLPGGYTRTIINQEVTPTKVNLDVNLEHRIIPNQIVHLE